jgi:hypothetical protein
MVQSYVIFGYAPKAKGKMNIFETNATLFLR